MTDNDKPPSGDDEFLPPNHGNWTNGTDPSKDGIEEFGTYVLSRQKFFEAWFVPKMRKINRMMSGLIHSPKMSFDADPTQYATAFRFPVLVGDECKAYSVQDPKDDAYSMTYSSTQPTDFLKAVKNAALPNLFPNPGAGALCWYYFKSPPDWDQHDSAYGSTCHSYAQCKPLSSYLASQWAHKCRSKQCAAPG